MRLGGVLGERGGVLCGGGEVLEGEEETMQEWWSVGGV